MICPRCATPNSIELTYCGNCGANIKEIASSWPATAHAALPGERMTFAKAVSTCLMKYVYFEGRASRAEYWWFALFNLALFFSFSIMGYFLDDRIYIDVPHFRIGISSIATLVATVALGFPSLAVSVRRLHDTNRSGWWILLQYTIIGAIPLYIWYASKGDHHANRFGHPR